MQKIKTNALQGQSSLGGDCPWAGRAALAGMAQEREDSFPQECFVMQEMFEDVLLKVISRVYIYQQSCLGMFL